MLPLTKKIKNFVRYTKKKEIMIARFRIIVITYANIKVLHTVFVS